MDLMWPLARRPHCLALQTFEVDEEIAQESQTIKNMIEDTVRGGPRAVMSGLRRPRLGSLVL